MSLHGNFERSDDGFMFRKGEFGEGAYHLRKEKNVVRIEDRGDVIASAEIEKDLSNMGYSLIEELENVENGEVFLEVVGGSDYLKDFLQEIVNQESIPNWVKNIDGI